MRDDQCCVPLLQTRRPHYHGNTVSRSPHRFQPELRQALARTDMLSELADTVRTGLATDMVKNMFSSDIVSVPVTNAHCRLEMTERSRLPYSMSSALREYTDEAEV
jgi:hypothetical protein